MDASEIKLILLPGMYGTAELFADFIDALPREFTAQAVEYRNDKFLSYAELLELIRSFVPVPEPYVVVAESFSTPLAIQFAATNPANLKGLVLSAGFATSPVRGLLRFLTPHLAPILGSLPVSELAGRLMLFGSAAPQEIQDRVRAAIASVKPRVLMDRVQAVVTCNALEDLRRVRVPMLFIQARHDGLVNAVCLEEIRHEKPEIEVMVLNATHMLLQQMPQETAEIVVNFVRGLR
jgi:pimeloyl-[acyl-carrier protein] methyl ester esterase